jgi:hypothetical protein
VHNYAHGMPVWNIAPGTNSLDARIMPKLMTEKWFLKFYTVANCWKVWPD